MQFSKKGLTSMIWDLGRYSEFETITKIRSMTYQAGKRTRTGDALTRVNNEVSEFPLSKLFAVDWRDFLFKTETILLKVKTGGVNENSKTRKFG